VQKLSSVFNVYTSTEEYLLTLITSVPAQIRAAPTITGREYAGSHF